MLWTYVSSASEQFYLYIFSDLMLQSYIFLDQCLEKSLKTRECGTVGDKIKFPLPTQKVVLMSLGFATPWAHAVNKLRHSYYVQEIWKNCKSQTVVST